MAKGTNSSISYVRSGRFRSGVANLESLMRIYRQKREFLEQSKVSSPLCRVPYIPASRISLVSVNPVNSA
jgi:hypothetical protein